MTLRHGSPVVITKNVKHYTCAEVDKVDPIRKGMKGKLVYTCGARHSVTRPYAVQLEIGYTVFLKRNEFNPEKSGEVKKRDGRS